MQPKTTPISMPKKYDGLHIVLAALAVLLKVDAAIGNSSEARLYDTLFTNNDYNPRVRPIKDAAKAVEVSISFYLIEVLGVNEKAQVLSTVGWLEVVSIDYSDSVYLLQWWKDEFLNWNPQHYGGVKDIVLPTSVVWVPADIGLENSVNDPFDEASRSQSLVHAYSDGQMQWSPGGRYSSSCQLNVRHFPYDRQNCHLEFTAWAHTKASLSLSYGSETIGTGKFIQHGEWELVSTSVSLVDRLIDNVTFPTVYFNLNLKRNPTYFFVVIVSPCLILSAMSLFTFLLPAESGEKVGLSISVLLSITFFLIMINDNVPHTSDTVPVLAIYLTGVLFVSGMSIVTNIIVMEVHFRESDSRPPEWMRTWLSGTALLHTDLHTDQVTGVAHVMHHLRARLASFNRHRTAKKATVVSEDSDRPIVDQIIQALQDDFSALKIHLEWQMQSISLLKQREGVRSGRHREWRKLAEGLDHALFVLFGFVLTVGFVFTFFILPAWLSQL